MTDRSRLGEKYAIVHTSIYRGVHWDRRKGRYRAEIEVRTKRYKLGWWNDDRDAALAYDVACERLGVPERRNFGAHPVYDELTLLRSRMGVCPTCRGACQTGGEFHPPGVAGSHGRFVRLGRWRECETCAGAGYLVDGRSVPCSPNQDALSLGVGGWA
jgi:hypothetical protein